MNKEEADLIITEQNKSTEEILKSVAKVKSDYHKLCNLKDMRIAELEKENAELKGLKDVATLIRANNDTVVTLMQLNNMLVSKSQQLTKAKKLLKEFVRHYKAKTIYIENMQDLLEQSEQFLKR